MKKAKKSEGADTKAKPSAKPQEKKKVVVEEEAEDDNEPENDEEEDEEVHLHGFSTDEDSSDEENDMDDEPSAFDVAKLPTIAKDDATVKKKLEKAKRKPVCILFFSIVQL